MLAGVIYRSLSDNTEVKNERLRELNKEAANDGYSHCIIMGDFNNPIINWDLTSTNDENSEERKFLDCIQDNYLFQVINKPTRLRGSNIQSILDLVLTKDDNAIDEIEYQSPLGKSNHCMIYFSYVCSTMMRNTVKKEEAARKQTSQI
jgi:hypothetical protein